MADLIPGRIDFAFPSYTNFAAQLADKQVKVLAIASPQRWSGTPDVPTLTELGYPGIDVDNLFGIAVPRGTPKEIIEKLNKAFVEASRDPILVKRMNELGAIPKVSEKPEELLEIIKNDTARLTPVIQRLGIKTQ